MLVVQLIWSVLVLITMLVTHQPACLNPFTISYPRAPWPPYTTTRPLIPELGVPESEATIGSAAYSHSHMLISAYWRLLLLIQPLGIIWKRKLQ